MLVLHFNLSFFILNNFIPTWPFFILFLEQKISTTSTPSLKLLSLNWSIGIITSIFTCSLNSLWSWILMQWNVFIIITIVVFDYSLFSVHCKTKKWLVISKNKSTYLLGALFLGPSPSRSSSMYLPIYCILLHLLVSILLCSKKSLWLSFIGFLISSLASIPSYWQHRIAYGVNTVWLSRFW